MAKYLDFINMFLEKSAIKLPKYTSLNKYFINFEKSKKLSYQSIFNFKLIKLKTFKIYIKTNLINNFIYLSKFHIKALERVIKKSNNYFYFSIDY